MIVVADTGPIHYLILSGQIELLHRLYGEVLLPEAVRQELAHPRAPQEVRQWLAAPPPWVSIRSPKTNSGFERLGPGEREALRLALEIRADLVLMDESLGRRLANQSNLPVKGTLGVLEEAAFKLNLQLDQAIEQLRQTTIYLDEKTIAAALDRDRMRRSTRFASGE